MIKGSLLSQPNTYSQWPTFRQLRCKNLAFLNATILKGRLTNVLHNLSQNQHKDSVDLSIIERFNLNLIIENVPILSYLWNASKSQFLGGVLFMIIPGCKGYWMHAKFIKKRYKKPQSIIVWCELNINFRFDWIYSMIYIQFSMFNHL